MVALNVYRLAQLMNNTRSKAQDRSEDGKIHINGICNISVIQQKTIDVKVKKLINKE